MKIMRSADPAHADGDVSPGMNAERTIGEEGRGLARLLGLANQVFCDSELQHPALAPLWLHWANVLSEWPAKDAKRAARQLLAAMRRCLSEQRIQGRPLSSEASAAGDGAYAAGDGTSVADPVSEPDPQPEREPEPELESESEAVVAQEVGGESVPLPVYSRIEKERMLRASGHLYRAARHLLEGQFAAEKALMFKTLLSADCVDVLKQLEAINWDELQEYSRQLTDCADRLRDFERGLVAGRAGPARPEAGSAAGPAAEAPCGRPAPKRRPAVVRVKRKPSSLAAQAPSLAAEAPSPAAEAPVPVRGDVGTRNRLHALANRLREIVSPLQPTDGPTQSATGPTQSADGTLALSAAQWRILAERIGHTAVEDER